MGMTVCWASPEYFTTQDMFTSVVHYVCPLPPPTFQFLAELSLLEVDPFLQHLPSKVAAASYSLSNYTLNRTFWVSFTTFFVEVTFLYFSHSECMTFFQLYWSCVFLLKPDSLYAFTGYTLAEIAPCIKDLHKLHQSAASRPQQAIREKYKSHRYALLYIAFSSFIAESPDVNCHLMVLLETVWITTWSSMCGVHWL